MKYTPSERELLFKRVIKELQNGRSLRELLRDSGMPSRTALYSWLDKDEKYQERFARAQEIGDDVLFEETIDIARTPMVGETEEIGPNGVTIKRGDMLGHRKLLIETIDKVLARRNPRKYGNKLDVTSDGKAFAVPAIIGMSITNETPKDDTDEQESRPENDDDML